MKQIALLFFLTLIPLQGCSKQPSNPFPAKSITDPFPEFLVGTWQGRDIDEGDWQLTFAPDGTLISMVHILGIEINVVDGMAYNEGTEGANETYILGPCTVIYDAKTHQLNVSITLEHFEIHLPIGDIEGYSRDVLTGTITKDGKYWRAQWWSYIHIKDGRTFDDSEVLPSDVYFHKVE